MLSDGTHPSFNQYYSTFSAVDASDSYVLIGSNNGAWRIKTIGGATAVPAGAMPAMNTGHPVWDASKEGTFYYELKNVLYEGAIRGHAIKATRVHTFAEYEGISSPDAADLSEDGDHIALVGENRDKTMDIFVWSLSHAAKTSVYRTQCRVNQWGVTASPQPGCLHKLLLTADNLLAIEFAQDGSGHEQGLRLWNGTDLAPLQNGTNHVDTGYDMAGNSIFIEVGGRSTLPNEENPCPSEWGLDVRQIARMSSAVCLLDHQPSWHVSYRGSARQPWAALSFFDTRPRGPEYFTSDTRYEPPSEKNWQLYEDEIVLGRIDGKMIYRLAQARSRSTEGYWSQPHASISRDGKYVAFTSDMGHPAGCPAKMHVVNECTDVYLIKVR